MVSNAKSEKEVSTCGVDGTALHADEDLKHVGLWHVNFVHSKVFTKISFGVIRESLRKILHELKGFHPLWY